MLKIENLENLLKTNWTFFINYQQLLKETLIHVRNANLPEEDKEINSKPQISIMLSEIKVSSTGFELQVDFKVPTGNHMAVGFHIFNLDFTGTLKLIKTFGTKLLLKDV